jgi:hypothetical protein
LSQSTIAPDEQASSTAIPEPRPTHDPDELYRAQIALLGELAPAKVMFRYARITALLWILAGLVLAGVGVATMARAEQQGGIGWTGAIIVGGLVVLRSLRTLWRVSVAKRRFCKELRAV